MRRRKTAFKINREDLNTKISEYIKKGGEVEKIEPLKPCEGPGCYKAIEPSICGCGAVFRNYLDGYFS